MKKTLLSSMLVGAMALSLSAVLTTPANAACPLKAPCAKVEPVKAAPAEKCDKPAPPPCEVRKIPREDMKRKMEEKKAEFEERMKLSDVQKKKIDELKAEEFNKIKKIKTETDEKIQKILTVEQKAELEKIKQEMKAERGKMMPHHMMKPMPPKDAQPCPPECKCPKCKK